MYAEGGGEGEHHTVFVVVSVFGRQREVHSPNIQGRLKSPVLLRVDGRAPQILGPSLSRCLLGCALMESDLGSGPGT